MHLFYEIGTIAIKKRIMIPIIHMIMARLAIPTASKELGLVSAKNIRQTNIANRIIQGMSI